MKVTSTVINGGTWTNTTNVPQFDIHAFLISPSVVSAVTAVAVPTLILLALNIAKACTTRKTSPSAEGLSPLVAHDNTPADTTAMHPPATGEVPSDQPYAAELSTTPSVEPPATPDEDGAPAAPADLDALPCVSSRDGTAADVVAPPPGLSPVVAQRNTPADIAAIPAPATVKEPSAQPCAAPCAALSAAPSDEDGAPAAAPSDSAPPAVPQDGTATKAAASSSAPVPLPESSSPPSPPASPPPPPPDTLSATTASAAQLQDRYENCTVIVYTLQLPTVCAVSIRTLVMGTTSSQHAALVVAIPVLVIEAAYALKLLRDIDTLQASRRMGTLQGLRGIFGSCQTPLSEERLLVRLEYLVTKYADHAPYWQYVLWARQLCLIVISVIFQVVDSDEMPLAEGAAVVGVLVASLVLHRHTQPYAYAYQNMMVTVLESFLVGAAILSCFFEVYNQRDRVRSGSVALVEMTVVSMLLGPLAIFSVWLAVGGRWYAIAPSDARKPFLAPSTNVDNALPTSMCCAAPLPSAAALSPSAETLSGAPPSAETPSL